MLEKCGQQGDVVHNSLTDWHAAGVPSRFSVDAGVDPISLQKLSLQQLQLSGWV